MLKSVKLNLFLFLATLGTISMSAQTEAKKVTDQDLNKFADAYQAVQMENQKAQQETSPKGQEILPVLSASCPRHLLSPPNSLAGRRGNLWLNLLLYIFPTSASGIHPILNSTSFLSSSSRRSSTST